MNKGDEGPASGHASDCAPTPPPELQSEGVPCSWEGERPLRSIATPGTRLDETESNGSTGWLWPHAKLKFAHSTFRLCLGTLGTSLYIPASAGQPVGPKADFFAGRTAGCGFQYASFRFIHGSRRQEGNCMPVIELP